MKSEPEAEFESEIKRLLNGIAAVIVEGKKDKAALGRLGLDSSRIFILNKKPLFEVAESVAAAHSAAAILTDLDSEGRKLYGKLNTLLQRLGVKVDNRFRNFLFKKTKVRQVEGVDRIIQQ